MKKERKVNIELLRLISMIMIVGLHFFLNCSINKINIINENFIFTWIMEAIFYNSVNCFIIITGYFGVKLKLNKNRILSICLITIFYSYLFLFLFILLNINLNAKNILISIFPIISGQYWFVTVYILLSLISPILNLIINTISRNNFKKGLFVSILIFSIIPTFYPLADYNINLKGGTNLIWFIILYFTGAYIRKYKIDFEKRKKLFIIFSCMFIVIFTKISFCFILNRTVGGAIFYHHNSIFIYISSVTIFLLFKNLNIKNDFIKKCILLGASVSFGVYIIHENIFIKNFIWDKILDIQNLNSKYWPIFAILTILIIFIFCSILEYFRQIIFRKHFIQVKLENLIFNNKFFEKIDKLLKNKNLIN
ncbi:acyltransferase [Clostridium perfringens]|uniref:acyltransferase n=1 Tax=Clostridium perfringens TaxID=1502 RepID=UPI003D2F6F47